MLPLHRHRLKIMTTGSFFATTLAIGAAGAATITWDGGGDGSSWDDPANWSTDQLPGIGDDVLIDDPVADIVVIHANGADAVRSLHSTEAFEMSGGMLAMGEASVFDALALRGGVLVGAGNITIDGALAWTGGAMAGAGTTFTNGDVSVAGPDTKSLERPLNNAGVMTWTGSGRFDVSGAAILCNLAAGTIEIANDAVLGWTGAPGLLDNRGTLRKADSPGTTDVRVPVVNSGALRVESGRFCVSGGDVRQTAGFTVACAEIELIAGVFHVDGGILCGTGLVDADVLDHGGTVAPGLTTGELTIDGRYLQGSGAKLAIQLGGTDQGKTYDVLTVTGDVELAGTIVLPRVSGFEIEPGQVFEVLRTDGAATGAFDEVACPALFEVVIAPDDVQALVTNAQPRGDVDCNAVVDFGDLARVLEAWGTCDGCEEDLDGSGRVDFDDVLIVLANWS